MANLNLVILVGNLTRDPEVRYTPSGKAVSDLSLAVNRTWVDRQTNEKKEEVCFVDIVVWGRQAETCGEYLSKGAPVLVEGMLQLDKWETQAGEKRSKLRVRARRVQFLGRRRDEASGAGPQPPRSPAAPSGGAYEEPGIEDDIPF